MVSNIVDTIQFIVRHGVQTSGSESELWRAFWLCQIQYGDICNGTTLPRQLPYIHIKSARLPASSTVLIRAAYFQNASVDNQDGVGVGVGDGDKVPDASSITAHFQEKVPKHPAQSRDWQTLGARLSPSELQRQCSVSTSSAFQSGHRGLSSIEQ